MNSNLKYWNIYCLSAFYILFKQSILIELSYRYEFLDFYFKNEDPIFGAGEHLVPFFFCF